MRLVAIYAKPVDRQGHWLEETNRILRDAVDAKMSLIDNSLYPDGEKDLVIFVLRKDNEGAK